MTWETVVGGALSGISNFVTMLFDIILGPINSTAMEGLIALILLGVAIRLINDAPKLPGKIIEKVKERRSKDPDEDEEFEWIQVRRRRR